jgi:FtsZ-binding cell division protein ZapB
MIDWNVRFGDLLVVASLAGTGLVYAFKSGRFAESIKYMQQEISALKELTKSLTGVLSTIAEQKKDIEYLREDVKELKHGRGFVQGERGINGEYPK